jgi:hypothetical protein
LKASKKAGKKNSEPTPVKIGFWYPDEDEYERAQQVIAGEGQTVTEFLISALREKSKLHGQPPQFVTETDLAKLPGMPSRMTLFTLRQSGRLDGLFVEKGRRILYDVTKAQAHFGASANGSPAKPAANAAR